MSCFAGPDVVEDGLVLALDAGNTKSYPGSGTSWTDLSGNGNNGTLVNGVGYNGGNGGSLSFDGVNDIVSIPADSGWLMGTSEFTIECWIYPTAVNQIFLFSHGEPQGWSTLGWYFFINSSSQFQLRGSTGGGPRSLSNVTAAASLNTWHHVAVTRELSGNTYIHLNGTRSAPYVVTGNLEPTTAIRPLYIGGGNTTWTFGNRFSGYISNLRIYKGKGLTAEEVQQNYNALKGRFQ